MVQLRVTVQPSVQAASTVINDLFDAVMAIPERQVDPDTGKFTPVGPSEVKDAALGAIILARIALVRIGLVPVLQSERPFRGDAVGTQTGVGSSTPVHGRDSN